MAEKFDLDAVEHEANLRGFSLTPTEAAANFRMHDPETRIAYLKTMRLTGDEEIPAGGSAMLKAARRLAVERALRNEHQRLSRIGK